MRLKTCISLMLPFVLYSCTKPGGLISEPNQVNKWVYGTMVENYLWASEIKDIDETQLNLGPEMYFNNAIRYRHDITIPYGNDTFGDRYSFLRFRGSGLPLTTVQSSQRSQNGYIHDYGFETRMFTNSDNTISYCQVIYVYPDSPAHAHGIRRGDCFNMIAGKKAPFDTKVYYTALTSEETDIGFFYPEEKNLTIRKGNYYATPVLHDTVFEEDIKVGYIAYNEFTRGESDRNFNRLKEIFGGLKSSGVKNLILDLRYNTGGELEATVQLASLIIMRPYLGKEFAYKERNSTYGKKHLFEPEYFLTETRIGHWNADIEKIVVITSRYTASASELLIHALKAFYQDNLTIIGERTEGKNLGGAWISNSQYFWEIYAVTMRMHNTLRESGYEEGIVPDIIDTELRYIEWPEYSTDEISFISELGDAANEPLLKKALQEFGIDTDGDGCGVDPGEMRLRKITGRTRSGDQREMITVPGRDLVENSMYTN